MMQWERKKPYSSSFSYQIGHVFPRSWISRFKKMTGSSTKSSPDNYTKRQENEDISFPGFKPRTSWNEGRFHGENEEAYWRLSFGEEKLDGVQNVGVFKSLWYDSDDELDIRNLISPQCLRAKEQNHKFSDVIPGRRNVKEYCQNDGILQGNEVYIEEQEIERFDVMRRRASQDIKSRKTQQREDKYGDLPRAFGNSTEYGRPIGWRKQSDSSNYRMFEEDFAYENLKMEKKKSEEKRKSATIRRDSTRKRSKRRRKVRVYTPRTAARIECKIRALEDLKKAKTKTKKMMTKDKSSNGITSFDSFAVVKTSTNPQEDFERSMVEMIIAEGITQPQELEELLACYLTLNCDEYHDLIITVFRQVWFELNQLHCKPSLQSERFCKL